MGQKRCTTFKIERPSDEAIRELFDCCKPVHPEVDQQPVLDLGTIQLWQIPNVKNDVLLELFFQCFVEPVLMLCQKSQEFNTVPAMIALRDYAKSVTKSSEALAPPHKLFLVKFAVYCDAVVRGMDRSRSCNVDVEESCNVLLTLTYTQSQCRTTVTLEFCLFSSCSSTIMHRSN